jgi:putative tricarboxylic transport membrane protein
MSFLAGKSRLVLAAVGALLACVYVWSASQLRLPAFSDPVGPRLIPYLIALGFLLSCLALVVEHVAAGRHRVAGDEEGGLTFSAVLTVFLLIAYYLLFDRLGFIASTTLFLLALLTYTNRDRWLTNMVTAFAFPVAAYLLLATLLGARLPAGIVPFG